MSRSIYPIMVIVALLAMGMAARADTPLYSFEAGTDGFQHDSARFVAVFHDTFGATEGSHSLLVGIGSASTFAPTMTRAVKPATDSDADGLAERRRRRSVRRSPG